MNPLEKLPQYGKEGAETDIEVIVQNMGDAPKMLKKDEFPLTDAEMRKYEKIQRDYLEFLIEYNFPIPKDKQQIFRIMILKDYYS